MMLYIQRCYVKTDKRSEITGPDSLLRYDYMGSAEYEFGALNRSAKEFKEYSAVAVAKTKIKASDGRGLFIVSRPEDADAVRRILEDLSVPALCRNQTLKEPAYLDKALAGETGMNYSVWWNLGATWAPQPVWFACLGKNVAENLAHAFKTWTPKWWAPKAS
jgi:hypothetical protein